MSVVPHALSRLRHRLVAPIVTCVLVAAACSSSAAVETSTDPATSGTASESASASASASAAGSAGTAASAVDSAVFDTAMVHDVDIEVDDAELAEVIDAYVSTGEKEWLSATVTIDGLTYEDVGLRLKGNSSLRGIGTDTPAESLPWLIRFDKYVDDQNHLGYADLVIRSNNSETALNEAVALDLLAAAGLASQQAVHATVSVNGSADELRLIIEHPDDMWMAEYFSADGALYKAESTGDYSYRGEDDDAYDEVFDQEAGKDNTDLAPLMAFLDFVNNSDDATFAAELGDHLDVEAFATYLAMMDLVDNFDDIDGPGNNSYLYYDPATDRFTVVPWDLNLAFGGGGFGGPGGSGRGGFAGGGFAPPNAPNGDLPEGFAPPTDAPNGDLPEGFAPPTDAPNGDLPEGFAPPTEAPDGDLPEGLAQPGERGQGGFGGPGSGGGGFGGGANPLVTRFLAVDDFAVMYDQALVDLQEELFDSGLAEQLLASRVATLESSSAVDVATIESDATALVASLA